MGRPLIPYACDNCVIRDVSGWTLPIVLGVLVALGLAVWCLLVSTQRSGARAVAARVAAVALAAGPLGGALAASWQIESHGAICGSALHASAVRGVPTDAALTVEQAGCQTEGRALVRGGVAAAATAAACAALLMAGSSLPRRRAAYA